MWDSHDIDTIPQKYVSQAVRTGKNGPEMFKLNCSSRVAIGAWSGAWSVVTKVVSENSIAVGTPLKSYQRNQRDKVLIRE